MAGIAVHIIESPGPKDFLNDVHEGRTLRAALEHSGIQTKLHTVVNRQMLFEAVRRTARKMAFDSTGKVLPVLHLSMHGNRDGVVLTSEEQLDWSVLGDIIDVLNVASIASLLVVMSTCHGFRGVKMADRETAPPFFALVGPNEDVPWSDTVGAFVAFYHHLQGQSGTIVRATKLANDVVSRELFSVTRGEDARDVFKKTREQADAFRDYLQRVRDVLDRPDVPADIRGMAGSVLPSDHPAPSE